MKAINISVFRVRAFFNVFHMYLLQHDLRFVMVFFFSFFHSYQRYSKGSHQHRPWFAQTVSLHWNMAVLLPWSSES